MRFDDKKNNTNDDSIFSYFGENESELNDNFEKLMKENKKPIYNSNEKESIFTSQASFKKYSNIKNLHVVSKAQEPTSTDEIQDYSYENELDEIINDQADYEQDYSSSEYKQSSYINDFDIIEENEETYDDIKNDITEATEKQFNDLDKYEKSYFNYNDDKTQFSANNNCHKSYSQIPTYAPKASSTKSSKENHRNSLVNDIVHRHSGGLYTENISSSSQNRDNSGINLIPLEEVYQVTSYYEVKKPTQSKSEAKIDLESIKAPKLSNEFKHSSHTAPNKPVAKISKTQQNNAKVLEFAKTKKDAGTAKKTVAANKEDFQTEKIKGFNPNINVKTSNKKPKSEFKRPEKLSNDNMALIAKIVAAAMGVAVVFGLIFYLFIGVEVKQITISGDSIYSQSEILEALNIDITDNILRISPNKVETLLVTDLPYLSEVEVEKSLSDGLKIEIVATTTDKILIETNDSNYISVDENLKVLAIGESNIENAYYFIGFESIDVQLGETLTLSAEEQIKLDIAKELASQFDLSEINADFYVDLSDYTDVVIYYDNKSIEIRLGDVLYPEKIIEAFSAINDYAQGSSGYINAYSYSGITVNLK